MNDFRAEKQIFSDLVDLCTQPGYSHVLAHLIFFNTLNGLKKIHIAKKIPKTRPLDTLIPNEISALFGCMIKSKICWTEPNLDQLNEMAAASKGLLSEYHNYVWQSTRHLPNEEVAAHEVSPGLMGKRLRHEIFYSDDSAYTFQFRDMAVERYKKDVNWIKRHRQYDVSLTKTICDAIFESQNEILNPKFREIDRNSKIDISMLSLFRLNVKDIVSKSGVVTEKVEAFLNAFTLDDSLRNSNYNQIDDLNLAKISPVIFAPDGERYLFQYSSLVESTYESPNYWFPKEGKYSATAKRHRGEFTEEFLANRLSHVFGDNEVFSNVKVLKGKRSLGEIDCLVVFGRYALIFQAKSKRITQLSRRGKIDNLKDDFQKAIQKAYDQAVVCAINIGQAGVKFESSDQNTLDLSSVEHVYPVCVLSDHYPALQMQTQEFLKRKVESKLEHPFVCDLFFIDVLTEMLSSPLRIISYIIQRAHIDQETWMPNEFVSFGYHLRRGFRYNVSFEEMRVDEIRNGKLYTSMFARRNNFPGEVNLGGVWAIVEGTVLAKIVSQIEYDSSDISVGVGLVILRMSEKDILDTCLKIDKIIHDFASNGLGQRLKISIGTGIPGLTIHINEKPNKDAKDDLRAEMCRHMGLNQARKWFGLHISPSGIQHFLEST